MHTFYKYIQRDYVPSKTITIRIQCFIGTLTPLRLINLQITELNLLKTFINIRMKTDQNDLEIKFSCAKTASLLVFY